MNFLFDNNFPLPLQRMIAVHAAHQGDHTCKHLADKFDAATRDEVWIDSLAAEEASWIVVGGDNRILRKSDEADALARSGLSFFFLVGTWWQQPFHDIAWKFVRIWPEVVREAMSARRPGVWEVPVTSTKLRLTGATARTRR